MLQSQDGSANQVYHFFPMNTGALFVFKPRILNFFHSAAIPKFPNEASYASTSLKPISIKLHRKKKHFGCNKGILVITQKCQAEFLASSWSIGSNSKKRSRHVCSYFRAFWSFSRIMNFNCLFLLLRNGKWSHHGPPRLFQQTRSNLIITKAGSPTGLVW